MVVFRHRRNLKLFVLLLAFPALLTGCCSTCNSISGRYSETPNLTEVIAEDGMTQVVSPVHIDGNLKQKMEQRGVQSGCGEFFWSSWYNDGPEEMIYGRPAAWEASAVQPTPRSSKAAHRITNSRPTMVVKPDVPDHEI